MKCLGLIFVSVFWLTSITCAQTVEARKIGEFGYVPCGHFMALSEAAFQEYIETPQSRIYVIYYEGKRQISNVWNEKLKKYEKQIGTRRGQALNRAKEVGIYLKSRKFPEEDLILIDGGYRDEFTLEIWIAPPTAKAPAPTPTVEEKDVIFIKGKPRPPRDCSKAYEGY